MKWYKKQIIQLVGETALQYTANVFKQLFFNGFHCLWWEILHKSGEKNKDYKLVENSTVGEISKNTG